MTPHKLRNIIFIIICICALSTAFIYLGVKTAHVLPTSFNNGTYSYLERAKLQTRPEATLENFKDGTFQSQTETWLTTKVPKRDSVMLLNAKMQRKVIETANLLTGFQTIPTFYGSNFAYNENLEVITRTSVQQSEEASRNFNRAAQAINEFASNHSDLSFTIAIPDRSDTSEASPTYPLTSKPIDNDYRQTQFINLLDPSIKYVDLTCSSTTEHFEKYFRMDHHWNIEGAVDAYKKIMQNAFPDLEQVDFTNKIEYDVPEFWGYDARWGLITTLNGDRISDYEVDLTGISIKINDTEKSSEDVEHVKKYENKKYNKQALEDRHNEYFHTNVAKIEFTSQKNTNRNLLIIGDSYLHSCERFYAHSFDKVVHIDSEVFKDSLQQLIDSNNITDVLFLQNDERYYVTDRLTNLIATLES